MRNDIKVSSLSESQKKEFMKQGKKLYFRSFEVCCPEEYQILYFDPNFLTDEDTTIQACYNYLEPNLSRIKKLSEDQKNIDAINIDAINDIIDEIYEEYDNFKWESWSDRYLNRSGFINCGEEIKYRDKSQDKVTAIGRLFKKLREKDKEKFKELLNNLTVNEENCEKIMDYLRLRMVKMKERKPHILKDYAKYEMQLDDINRNCLKSSYYEDPNDVLIERTEEKKNKIVKQREKELNSFIEQIDSSEICSIIEKHNRNISNASGLINDNEKLIEELRQYGQVQVFELINKLNIINDDLRDLIEEAIGGVFSFNYVKDQTEYNMRYISLLELALQQEERESLEEYKKNSIENQNKVKNKSEAFWPIDSNGKEIMWERCPIVMIKKEE